MRQIKKTAIVADAFLRLFLDKKATAVLNEPL